MARLYADENFPRQVVEELRRLGHDVLTVLEAGLAGRGIPDPEVLAFAQADGRALMTLNRKHFIQLHAGQSSHHGIIVCTFDHDFVAQAARIDAAISSLGQLDGQLVRVNRPHQ